ncbi:helix-turn-helix domain-containing protein [Bradyrhizobium sp. BRP23]|uniref:helix-turn-helix domain-containing protein n=1 Tax=Bradyrhizobium sp. BRP23 TaxID=2793820 RepID=UPI001CD47822|nr:helix-turn-helix domain-containing protein [Bradyrhizobium sp. BRP23]MCA1381284.1 helix-turn-helix domain-containing protein [Bradyrhizobium sp. BRP05]MCA1418596.1 helix-turn-helix domain-containing protein [Bradyrhizobium sp. BRP23]
MSNPRLSIIPAGAVTDRSLEPRDLQTLCLLGRHIDRAGWCTRSQVRMAGELGCGRATLQRSLDRLYEAGWVEKKRRDVWRPEDSAPSSSYAYRVKLDRDDFDLKSLAREADDGDDESHAENAEVPENGEGVPAGGQGCPPLGRGAHPSAGTGAHTYAGTKNDPLERPLKTIERDAGARARDRKERFKAEFRKRWPTAVADDRNRTDYAADALTADEEKAALDGIDPFLEELKRAGRKVVPAGWRYLEEKRWTLLRGAGEGSSEPAARSSAIEEASDAGRAVLALYAVAKARPFVNRGQVIYPGAVTPQLLAFAGRADRAAWRWISDRRQIAAWQAFLGAHVFGARVTLLEQRGEETGFFAPHDWPPRVDGTWSEAPEQQASAEASQVGGDE